MFYHIPKTGGTTVRSFLKKYYGDHNIIEAQPGINYVDKIEKNPKKKLFLGHAEYGDVVNPQNYLQFTILRNPLELHRSNYFFLKQFSKQYNRTQITSLIERDNLTFESYLLRIKEFYSDNMITRIFSNKSIYRDIFDVRFIVKIKEDKNSILNDNDLDFAINNLKKIKVYIFENLDMNKVYKSFNTKIYLPIEKINKTIEKKDLSDTDVNRCREINNYDFRIYENFKNN